MNAFQRGGECPLDLKYAEPAPVALDLAAIVGRGRVIGRWRRAAQAVAAVAACAALASIGIGLDQASFTWFPASTAAPSGPAALPIDASVALNPPVGGKLTLVSSWPAHWTTVAWGTRTGQVCWASYRTPALEGTWGSECQGGALPGEGGKGLSGLQPGIEPLAPSDGPIPEIGLVTPRATRVTVTFFGRVYSAGVVPVPMAGGKTVGVYLVWMRMPAGAHGSYTSVDFGGEVAYDQAGHVVARQGPGM
jgi:hypothetical protein